MDNNRIEDAAGQVKRARDREALVIKAKWRPTGISVGYDFVIVGVSESIADTKNEERAVLSFMPPSVRSAFCTRNGPR